MSRRMKRSWWLRRKAWFVGDPALREAHERRLEAGETLGPLTRDWREGEPVTRVKCRVIPPEGAAPGGMGPPPLRRPEGGGRVKDTMLEPWAKALRYLWVTIGKRSPSLGGWEIGQSSQLGPQVSESQQRRARVASERVPHQGARELARRRKQMWGGG